MKHLDQGAQNQIIEQEVADAEDALILASATHEVPEWYVGSLAEAVDNMSQREVDHLKGREGHPDDQRPRCDAIRAR